MYNNLNVPSGHDIGTVVRSRITVVQFLCIKWVGLYDPSSHDSLMVREEGEGERGFKTQKCSSLGFSCPD